MDFSISLLHCGAHSSLPAAHVHGPGICDCYCIQFCTRGCGSFIVDGSRFDMKEGEFIVNFPGQTKTEIADPITPWGLSWLSFSGKTADELFAGSSITREKPIRSFEGHKYLLELLLEMVRIFESSEIKNDLLLGEKFFRFMHGLSSVSASCTESAQDNYVSRAKRYMELCYHQENLTVQKLSDRIGLNRSYLYELFKVKTGISPQQYLIRIRMQKASELLLLPSATATSVAHAVGYEPSVFSKAFKTCFGISPGEYRKQKTHLR